jgi:threonyl-tRNA synthetase
MENNEQLGNIRHTLAHLLAAATQSYYPDVKLTLGPAIDNGFYYDMDFGADKITEAEIPTLTEKMRELLPTWTEFTHETVTAERAQQVFAGNQYKLELIDEIVERGEDITLYTCGGFTDLCRGGHCNHPNTDIDPESFVIDRIAGAYWRGDENNKMLTRVYGLAFNNKAELDAEIWRQEEAVKRDHRKLGKELKLFTLSPLIGSGLPLLQPAGMILRNEIEKYLWELHSKKGYERVWTPHIAKINLYETSGHAAKFGDELFKVQGKEESFIMKPMNCPHHMQIFADNAWSYRDMPVRYFEPATVYRDEKTGQLSGLTRVRAITQDDGHLFCRPSQIGVEIKSIVGIIKEFYTTLGMMDGYWVRLSLRGDDTTKYLGSDEVWQTAEKSLTDVCNDMQLNYRPAKDEAAFYGPKLDFMFRDAIGREWQLATVQCDFNLPERFELSYINESGQDERPVVIHRAISGSFERFLGVAIEHFAGAFPVWLAPTQVAILPVSAEHHGAYADELYGQLKQLDIRTTLASDESLGKRIRNAKNMRIPYQIVIGDTERDSGTVTVEGRNGYKEVMSREGFIMKLEAEIRERTLN